jgi:tryptophan synthase alpha subunit
VKAGADGVIVGSRIVKDTPDVQKIEKTCTELRSALSSQ